MLNATEVADRWFNSVLIKGANESVGQLMRDGRLVLADGRVLKPHAQTDNSQQLMSILNQCPLKSLVQRLSF